MSFDPKTIRIGVIVVAISASAVMFGYATGTDASIVSSPAFALAQADATSAATGDAGGGDASGESSGEAGSDAVSAASEEADSSDPEYCLKCHGPFEKLQSMTEGYVTEWDEVANPHVYVPHDSKTLVSCGDCHDPHAIPYAPAANAREPNVNYCYSCHHAETLVHCNECHKE